MEDRGKLNCVPVPVTVQRKFRRFTNGMAISVTLAFKVSIRTGVV
jgi:hypothetical protein